MPAVQHVRHVFCPVQLKSLQTIVRCVSKLTRCLCSRKFSAKTAPSRPGKIAPPRCKLRQARFEAITAVRITVLLFWVWSNVGSQIDTSFSEKYFFHLQDWGWRQHVSPKRWYQPTNIQGIRAQKIIVVRAVAHSKCCEILSYYGSEM
jgi:hypothetical protein